LSLRLKNAGISSRAAGATDICPANCGDLRRFTDSVRATDQAGDRAISARDQRLSVEEIAQRIGYAEPSTLRRLIRRDTKHPPGHFRPAA
jgi:AraC-like DNA-binding protein